jgi:nucleotide-binding universal stress UspA family protein
MYQKILIPLDGSTLAEQALPQGIALATAFDGEIYLLQVVSNYLTPPTGMDFAMGETFRDVALREAHEYLKRIHHRLESLYAGPIHIKVIDGLVAENIIDYADFQGCDLIVMATHGRSGVGRWVFGSIAERVLRASHCPILLIRSSEKHAQDVFAETAEAIPHPIE